MHIHKIIIVIFVAVILNACSKKDKPLIVSVKNTLDIDRSFETVELTRTFLKLDSLANIGIRNVETGQLELIQLVDYDGDGVADNLLFQPKIASNSVKAFEVVIIDKSEIPEAKIMCYSRFVPERIDDYAWENNKVAFRTFGPTAQKMFEDGVKGGTLSSGVDAWLKKVEYPIINKWYKKELETEGSYHEDIGEGLDNFHVGISRGVGGVAVKNDTTFYVSKNYTKWKTITTGPIRTSFCLGYDNWDAGGNEIKEVKTISLDYGSNLSKFEEVIEGTNTLSAGLTLHEKDGKTTSDNSNWVSYWQPHGTSELGTAILTSDKYFNAYEEYISEHKDLSNAYLHLNVIDGKVIYYAGYAWKESNQFKDKQAWEDYLTLFAKKLKRPLQVSLN